MKKAIVLFLLICPTVVFSETVEQIVAVVNEQTLLLSDLRRAEVFFGQTLPPAQQVQEQVEHQLLLHEAKRFIVEPPSPAAVNQGFNAVERRFKNKTEFQRALHDWGMQEGELKEMIADRIWVKTFLEDRIGFFIFVRDEEVDRYTQEHPEAFAGLSPQEKGDQIRAVLKAEQEKIKTREYIEQLRSRAKIQILGMMNDE